MIAIPKKHGGNMDNERIYEVTLLPFSGAAVARVENLEARGDDEAIAKATALVQKGGNAFRDGPCHGHLRPQNGLVLARCYTVHLKDNTSGVDVCSGYSCFFARSREDAIRIFDAIEWHHCKQLFGAEGLITETQTPVVVAGT